MFKKKILLPLLLIFGVLILGLAFYFILGGEEKEYAPDDIDQTGNELTEYAISYQEDGILRSYEVKTGKEKETFDLKTLSEPRKEEKEIIKVVEKKVPKKTVVKKLNPPVVETFQDFDMVRVTISKGDNAWNIQSKLTPNRNPVTMLKHVKDANEYYNMHPIYPGQQYIFLKEKTTPAVEMEVEETVVEEEIVKEEVKTVETVLTTEDTYDYYPNVTESILYAHSDFDKAVYQVKINEKGKFAVSQAFTHEEMKEITAFVATQKNAYFQHAESNVITHLTTSSMEEVQLYGEVELAVDSKGQFVYSFDDFVGVFDAKTGEQKQALLGDKTSDLLALGDKVFALNVFGSGKENSVVFKINPTDLYVDKLVETQSDEVSLVSHGEDKELMISRVKKMKDLEGNKIEEEQIGFINAESMRINKDEWKHPFILNGFSYKGYLYVEENPEEKHVSIYPHRKGQVAKELTYDGDAIMFYTEKGENEQ